MTNEPADGLVEGLDGAFVTPRWGVLNTNVEGRWRRMKSRIATVLGVALCSMLAFSMNVRAVGMDLYGSVYPTEITLGNVAYVEANWTATASWFGIHYKCDVLMIFKDFFEDPGDEFEVSGSYTVGSTSTGDVTVYCSGDYGWAWYNWTTDVLGVWYVDVQVDAWDWSQNHIYGGTATNLFEVTEP